MAARLPLLYAMILAGEAVALLLRYTDNPPSSSAPLSVNLGWGGLLAMVIMLIYSIARRSRGLRQVARLSTWLHFHIFMGFQGALLVLFHSAHLFTRDAPISVLNPGFLSFIAVMVVFFSGIFGRYMYSLLPRSIKGERIAVAEAEKEIAALGDVPNEVKALWADAKQPGSLFGLIKADLDAMSALGALKSMDLPSDVKEAARRRLYLERRLISAQAAERIFRRWIIAHRPLAAIMYVLAVVVTSSSRTCSRRGSDARGAVDPPLLFRRLGRRGGRTRRRRLPQG